MATILVVDDRPIERQYLTTLLNYGGHRMLEAADGVEGLRVARETKPDLIISDLLMPTMDGFDFVRHLRTYPETRETRVVFYTASYLQYEAQSLAKACGVEYIILKPAEPQVVLDVVSKALGSQPVLHPDIPLEDFHQEHVRLVTSKLSRKLDEVIPRLAALIAVGQELGDEPVPKRLLQNFCHLARDLIGAKFCATVILDAEGRKVAEFFQSGLHVDEQARIGHPPALRGLLGAISDASGAVRVPDIAADPRAQGFPRNHPVMRSFLGTAIDSPIRRYGYVYMCDKVGILEFDEEDEQLIMTLASQLAIAYENTLRYEEIKRLNVALEERVASRTADLEAANEELGSFSYSVSHDLRAPLRVIDGYSGLLLEEYGDQLPAEARRYVEVVRRNVQQMGTLIDDLLQFSRTSRAPLESQSVSMVDLVQEVLGGLQGEQTGRRADVVIGKLLAAEGDPVLLKQVWQNLIANAFKFTGKREEAHIEIGSKRTKGQAVYYVKDNGAGFDMKHADKLFGVFQRLHRNEDFEGTGVGLATVQRILHRHGGRIWAEAEEGVGAAFYFTVGGEIRNG